MNKSKVSLTILLLLLLNTLFAQTIEGVKYESYPAKVSNAKKSKIDYASHPKGKLFKTAITEEYNANSVNFGGHYICTFWGAGQGMTGGVMADILTGKLYSLPLTSDNSYRQTYYNENKNIFNQANSNLFVCYRNEPSAKDPNLVNLYYHFYEWNDKTKKFTLLKKQTVVVPVENDALVTDQATDITVTLNQKGTITLAGKEVGLENLKKELQNKLVKYPVVPDDVPVKYIGETGMGMRSEVRTEVAGAIAGAKWLKKSKNTTTIAAKSVTTTPSVVVDKKGNITLSGKKVTFENLKKELQAELVKLPTIPKEVPIKFDENLLMGMRGEVRTEVSEAIAGAKWLKKKASIANNSVTTTPSVVVDKKGNITLSGKIVTFENLRKELQRALVKLPTIPNEIPITFDENILMGTRSEVRSEVSDAIAGAKWLKKKASLSVSK